MKFQTEINQVKTTAKAALKNNSQRKIKRTVKKLWLAALRSGKYKQGKGALRRPNQDGGKEYCCLGVLCDVHRKVVGGSRWNNRDEYDGMVSYLGPKVAEWVGGVIPQVTLATKNDCGKSFAEIADYIEKLL
jgi:hypothetical protein